MSEYLKLAAISSQILLVALGCLFFWHFVASPRARAARQPSPLAPWEAQGADLLMFVLHVFAGMFAGSMIASLLAKAAGITGDHLVIFGSGGGQLGMLAGIGLFTLSYPGHFRPSVGRPRHVFLGGLVAFLIAMPFVFATGFLWTSTLDAGGLPVEKQLAVDIFSRTESPGWLLLFAVTAVLIAPAAEELVFRAGLFRYLRTRIPRWAALALSGCLFASLHMSLTTYPQLVVLGVVFALAYERTGHIGTAMVAHAAFNLNNVLLLLTGIDD